MPVLAKQLPNHNIETIMKKVIVTDTCWLWGGSVTRYGYGVYGHIGRMAHRIVYSLLVRNLEETEFLDHLCRNRKCVNPKHLEVVSLVENVMRGESLHARNARKTECKNGHAFDEANTYIHPKRGTRHCKTCARIANSKHALSKKGNS